MEDDMNVRRHFRRGQFLSNAMPSSGMEVNPIWQQSGWTPMRKLGMPADLGNAVALLCSPEANWITGQILDVDGGASLMDAHLPLAIQQIPAKQVHAA